MTDTSAGVIHILSRDRQTLVSRSQTSESSSSSCQAVHIDVAVAVTRALRGGGGMCKLYFFKVQPALHSFSRITNPTAWIFFISAD